MSNFAVTNKLSREQLKLALIPMLGLVLLAVLFWPSGEKEQPVVTRSARPVLTPTNSTQPLLAHQPNWPKVRLEDVTAFSPFDPPAPAAPIPSVATNTEQENVEEEIMPKPVLIGKLQAVYQTADGMVAILNSRIVRVGDRLPNGSLIVEITEQSILVDRDR